MCKKKYKFKIEEKLNELPYEERNRILKAIPQQLGIGTGTFYEWRRILLGAKQDIPATKLAALAKLFGCNMEEMINCEIPIISRSPITKTRSSIANKYGMSTR